MKRTSQQPHIHMHTRTLVAEGHEPRDERVGALNREQHVVHSSLARSFNNHVILKRRKSSTLARMFYHPTLLIVCLYDKQITDMGSC